jgi:hypothetical protein
MASGHIVSVAAMTMIAVEGHDPGRNDRRWWENGGLLHLCREPFRFACLD